MQYEAPTPALVGGHAPLLVLAFVLGILIYFLLPFEPSVGEILTLSTVLGVVGGLAVVFGRHEVFWYGGWGVLFVACALLGAGYGGFRTSLVTPAFWPAENTQRVWLSGQVTEVNPRSNGFATVHLRDVKTYENSGVNTWPKMVVITHNSRATEATPGGEVAAQAKLRPPQVPLHPSQPDWRRRSFFEQVSGTGLVMGDFYTTPPEATSLEAKLRATREDIASSYLRQKKDPAGGVGAALLTGVRSGIPPATREDFTRSGLAHLMAISGMHLGMVAGFVYILTRFLLVRVGSLPLYMDIRKPAAGLAFVAAMGYAVLAGGTIPTLRALALIGAALLAILFDRLHLGVRILGFIALALALYAPHWVAGPSFQLSFVASLALLLWAFRQREDRLQLGRLAPKKGKVTSVFKASLVAALATAPVVAVHFGQVPLLGVFANVLAVPYLGLVILPLGFLTLLPFGAGEVIKPVYLTATAGLNDFAAFVAAQPASTINLPPEAYPFAFITAWGLLLAFIFQSWRLAGVGALAVLPLFITLSTQPHPVLLVYRTGDVVASENGYKVFAADSRNNRALEKVTEDLSNTVPDVRCDSLLCSTQSNKKTQGHQKTLLTYAKPWGEISPEDCRLARWVFLRHQTPCPGQNLWHSIKPALENNTLIQINRTPHKLTQQSYKAPDNRPWNR